MADPQSLLQPLRSDSLKPRASAQAVWNTEAAPPSLEEPSFPTLQQSSGRSANAPVPPEIPFAADGDLTLDDVLSSLVPVCIEEEEPVNETDAVPSERMPVPVCVPLFEKFPTVYDMARADLSEIEEIIRPCMKRDEPVWREYVFKAAEEYYKDHPESK